MKFQRIDLTGQKFNKVTVLSYSHRTKSTYWNCLCDCGNKFVARSCRLKNGATKSCGCLHKTRMITHGCTVGHKKTPEFNSWKYMKNRCDGHDKHHNKYYKGKGISYCERWDGKSGFQNFLDDMGCKPTLEHTLDRIDNNKGYSKENCRWATKKEQMNNMTKNRTLTYNGETMNICQWAERIGLGADTIRNRIVNLKWSIEKSLITPKIPNNAKRARTKSNI